MSIQGQERGWGSLELAPALPTGWPPTPSLNEAKDKMPRGWSRGRPGGPEFDLEVPLLPLPAPRRHPTDGHSFIKLFVISVSQSANQQTFPDATFL